MEHDIAWKYFPNTQIESIPVNNKISRSQSLRVVGIESDRPTDVPTDWYSDRSTEQILKSRAHDLEYRLREGLDG